MILHQICAFVYYMAPLFYLAEKIAHVHHKSMWWKVPVRLPISKWSACPLPVLQGAMTCQLLPVG